MFVDNRHLQGDTLTKCRENIFQTTTFLTSLGFIIHSDKSIFKPTLAITFLGFNTNPKTLTPKMRGKI